MVGVKMKDELLTERHNQMLSTLAQGLRLGYIKPTWAIFYSDDRVNLIVGLDDRARLSESEKNLWYSVTHRDIDLFVESDLMKDLHHMSTSKYRYLQLNVERIKQDFLPQIRTK